MDWAEVMTKVRGSIHTREDGTKFLKMSLEDFNISLAYTQLSGYTKTEQKKFGDSITLLVNTLRKIIGLYYMVLKTNDITFKNSAVIDEFESGLYIESLVEYFIVNYNKIFDIVAQIFPNIIQNRTKILEFKDFVKLIRFMRNKKNSIMIETGVYELFTEFKGIYVKFDKIRNCIIHENGTIIAFPLNDTNEVHILPLINFAKVHDFGDEVYCINENKVIDFELFAAYYISFLIFLFDRLGTILEKKYNISPKGTVQIGCYGLKFLEESLEKIEVSMKKNKDSI